MLAIRSAASDARGPSVFKSRFLDSSASLSLGAFLELGAPLQEPQTSLVRESKLNTVESYSCSAIAKTPVESYSCKIDAGTPLESHSLQKNRGVPPHGAIRVPFDALPGPNSRRISTYGNLPVTLIMRLARALLPSVCTIAAAAILLAPTSASAQVSAAVSGQVEDASGAGVGAATVTVKSLETGATRSATTDHAGDYRVLSVPRRSAGTYRAENGLQVRGAHRHQSGRGRRSCGECTDRGRRVSSASHRFRRCSRRECNQRRCLGPCERARSKGFAAERPELRHSDRPESRNDQLQRLEKPEYQHQQREYVFGGRPAHQRESVFAQWHRVHRLQPTGHHAGRHQRLSPGNRRRARIQRAHRRLLGRIRQASGRAGERGHPLRHERAARHAIRVSPQ